ncbi:TIMELESS-interacting protein isoform X1 [Poecilia formosa]|uniref:TIMELESS-interacting protein isoform X1 n=1 Tax=Poecilia formosa TaxID=48698 RepID=UPI0007B7DA13|nr:PREDICTED: TIMELESS-interacting protein isoform X1 [Poecilia formosa]
MNDQQDDGMSDLSNLEDEAFPPLPPPLSPGAAQSQDDPFGEAEEGEVSKLADVPAAKRKGVKRPQPKLDSQRLISDRGLPALRTLFANARFKGKGHEAEDLRLLMQKMENWAHRLFPKLQFEDFIDRVEKLGSKKEVQTCLKRIRLDMPLTDEDFMDKPGAEELPAGFQDPDPFISQASSTDPPGPVHSTPVLAPVPAPPSLTEEQRRRMEQNRQRALERRLARQQQTGETVPPRTTRGRSEPGRKMLQEVFLLPQIPQRPRLTRRPQQEVTSQQISKGLLSRTRSQENIWTRIRPAAQRLLHLRFLNPTLQQNFLLRMRKKGVQAPNPEVCQKLDLCNRTFYQNQTTEPYWFLSGSLKNFKAGCFCSGPVLVQGRRVDCNKFCFTRKQPNRAGSVFELF